MIEMFKMFFATVTKVVGIVHTFAEAGEEIAEVVLNEVQEISAQQQRDSAKKAEDFAKSLAA